MNSQPASLPHVHVMSLGGTIASRADPAAQASGGVRPEIAIADLLSAVPSIGAISTITTEQIAQLGSASLGFAHIAQLLTSGRQAAERGATGLVVTQGTDTIEETAFLLSILSDAAIPYVVTGAMRSPTLPGADGPANLVAAVSVAADRRCNEIGALVVMNDEIHDPLYVRKMHSTSPAAFSSGPQTGPIGQLSEDEFHLFYRPTRVRIEAPESFGSVALISAAFDDDLRMLTRVTELGYDGVVIDGLGGGHVPAHAMDHVTALADVLPVVVASRTGSGRALQRTYGYPGSEIDLQQHGVLMSGPLDARKARLALSALTGSAAIDIADQWRALISQL
ncbi:MAG: asparaginase [Antricoccus sp.]